VKERITLHESPWQDLHMEGEEKDSLGGTAGGRIVYDRKDEHKLAKGSFVLSLWRKKKGKLTRGEFRRTGGKRGGKTVDC